MDYVVGSVAALVTGNVTPNRPRLLKKALTPTKHQPSPNVTPKSEFVEDRSIFLSPSMQKKKAIVKKSPKRIFQNPDLETTDHGDENFNITSPKADKVKKHLKEELEGDKIITECKSPKNKGKPPKNKRESVIPEDSNETVGDVNEHTPKKKKKKNSVSLIPKLPTQLKNAAKKNKKPKKMKQRRKSVIDENDKENDIIVEEKLKPRITLSPTKKPSYGESVQTDNQNINTPKTKNRKRKRAVEANPVFTEPISEETEIVENNQGTPKLKHKKNKKSKLQNKTEPMETDQTAVEPKESDNSNIKEKKTKSKVNPNAITEKESDSEHESDNEIESETEEINKKVFDLAAVTEESTDDDENGKQEQPPKEKVKKKEVNKETSEEDIEDVIKRTLFVGNVPYSAKCKKEIKKIFNKHGQIETIRIRTVPVKDARYTPKLALIKSELHPERTTVNVYIKYKDEESIVKALSENNTVLNGHHLRVSRSSHSGAEHDPKCSIFVGNLPFAMEDEMLRQKFENCGEIESVRIVRDKKTNAGKGFGYVNFSSKDSVELSLALTEEDLTVKNRIIRVKRCTQLTHKQKQTDKSPKQFNQKSQGQRQRPQGLQRQNKGPQGQNQGPQRQKQGPLRQNQGFHRGGKQGPQRYNQGFQKGDNQESQRGRYQGGPRDSEGGPKYGAKDGEGRDGAHRRIMNKRKNQDDNKGGGEGPPNKKQKNINQPSKEKKIRKEFVGMTAEKKKKRKLDKGQKKKKALSEILTK